MTANPTTIDSIGSGIRILFTTASETWTVDPGVIVGSTDNRAASSDQSFSTLDNFGVLYNNSAEAAVVFTGNNGLIKNESGATISDYYNFGFPLPAGGIGVRLVGSNDTIDNFGGIFGIGGFFAAGVWFDPASTNALLTNHGSVYGVLDGVLANSHHDGSTVQNFASISSLVDGVLVNTVHGLTTQVTNAKGAVIAGGVNAIDVSVGALNLVNAGTLNGALVLGDGTAHDNITNKGNINGYVSLGGAFDFYSGAKGKSGDIFTGAGHDIVLVGKGHVSVHIYDGGNTTVTAGTGHDKFIFDNGLGGGNIVIRHFSAATDHIVLSEAIFGGLGPLGTLKGNHFGKDGNVHNGLPQIVYNSHDGFLFYDSNGEFPGGQTHFATLAGAPPIGHASFLLVA
jgi:hypothetical protein